MWNQAGRKYSIPSFVILGLCVGCTGGGSGSAGSNANSAPNIDFSLYAKATTLCSPLAGASSVPSGTLSIAPTMAYNTGLIGRLWALNSGAPEPSNLAQLFANSSDQGVNVFLSDVNVPTRDFTEGFPNAAGQLLANTQGQTLLEWFGLDLYSGLMLQSTDAPGPYQLALLADDGAVLYLDPNNTGSFESWINDDNTHPTTMACATAPLEMQPNQVIPLHLQYFQGPRYQIALMMMWRPYPVASQVGDPLCGASGNYEFFNPDLVPSKPEQNYINLLTRGWVPIPSQNFVIPGSGFNPCNVPNYFGAQ